MRLHHSPTSPFVRKVLVCAIELGIERDIERVAVDVWTGPAAGGADNPLNKIPALVTAEGTFAGSDLICRYLDSLGGGRLYPAPGAGWDRLRIAAFADGIMEATVARTIETVRRQQAEAAFVERAERRIEGTLDLLERDGLEAEKVDIATITAACTLAYLDLRAPALDWRRGRPRLAAFLDAFETRPSMVSTRP